MWTYFIHFYLMVRFLFSLQHPWTVDSIAFSAWRWSQTVIHTSLSTLCSVDLGLVLSSFYLAQIPRICHPTLGLTLKLVSSCESHEGSQVSTSSVRSWLLSAAPAHHGRVHKSCSMAPSILSPSPP